jgi:hypothetical protein
LSYRTKVRARIEDALADAEPQPVVTTDETASILDSYVRTAPSPHNAVDIVAGE